ncbi:glycoside hydrolase family 15 protein [Streptomyces sp. NPDC006971]|uniref:glycoside hydrolase family 15 protein n=1 Tax=Streptomyces sp. NPDC006971 TaxID=3154784 RepID=UPI0033C2B70A
MNRILVPRNATPEPHALRDYALIADGERGALVGPSGDISWLCAPHWHSDAVFAALIGGPGHYSVTPRGRFVHGGYYEEGGLIWRNRWITETGIVECRDALVFPGDPHRTVLLRRVGAVDGTAEVMVRLEPWGGFGTDALRDVRREDGGTWTGRNGALRWRWHGARKARPVRRGLRTTGLAAVLTLRPGRPRDLVLEIRDGPLGDPVVPSRAWAATQNNWARAVPGLASTLAPEDARHTWTVLRSLTSSTGGMVGAATTSLPERAEEGRNYDYRYVWIRDQCYAGQALAACGGHELLDDTVRFVCARLHEDGPRLAPAYTITGGPVPDQRTLGLPGYPGGYDRVGNWVNRQFQLDVFGEALLLFSAAHRLGRLDADGRRAAEVAADAIARRWQEPDAGIWELENRPWTHSRLICAAGLRSLAETAPARVAASWAALADRIVAATSATALHPAGRWQRSPGDPHVDAALLLPPLRGALPAEDPRTRATLLAFKRELTTGHYAYRFRHDERPLEEAEGAFLLCGFIMALAEHQQHRREEALRWFERNRAACGTTGLFAEEFDIRQRQLRGNVPQAFVHALFLESATRLAAPPP